MRCGGGGFEVLAGRKLSGDGTGGRDLLPGGPHGDMWKDPALNWFLCGARPSMGLLYSF